MILSSQCAIAQWDAAHLNEGVETLTRKTIVARMEMPGAGERKGARLAEVTTGRADVDGVSIYFESRGEGPTLLMIPGGGGDAGGYRFVGERLADEYRVVSYDRRGNSRSSGRNGSDNHELLPFVRFVPDCAALRARAASVVVAAGRLSKGYYYARTCEVLARELGCRFAESPGHHTGCVDMPDEFAAMLREVLR
jgi:hypothetical protein